VINSGSSSLKYQVIDTENKRIVIKGNIERIASGGHGKAITEMLRQIEAGGINLSAISAVGHRVVHGGEKFTDTVTATEEVIAELKKISNLAPLHNPANILGVTECMKRLPHVPNVLVFDTAFHSAMRESAYLYGLPYDDYKIHGIRKYGFHGTSHKFVSAEAAKILRKPISKLKLVSCHIGNGASIAAIDGGVSVDTSMGMTPLAGLVMGTRSGDIDPSVVATLCKVHNFTVDETIDYLNRQSGLLGLFGHSSDMRDIEAEFASNPRAKTAVSVFVHAIVQYVGGYIAQMGGCDAIIWTGGIGIHRTWIADMVMARFRFLPKVKRLMIPTNEELEIALECKKHLLSAVGK
jgi:acetate kinase